MPTTETLLQSPTIDLIDNADLLWVWNSSASALTKATRASVVGDIDLLFSNGSDKQISINNSPAATVGRQLTVQAGNVASGTNLSGGNLSLNAGVGTGTGNSNLIFSTGESTGSATSVQTLTERMRITNSGNVGIGTTTTDFRLEVNKGNLDDVLKLVSSRNTGGASIISLNHNRGTANVQNGDQVSLLNTYTDSNTTANAIRTYVRHVTVDRTNGTQKSGLSFWTQNSSDTVVEAMRISGGNVGIGTTDPGRKLHVAGTIIVDGDEGGIAGTVGFTDVSDLATRSTGVGTIKFDDGTNRDSSGFIKVYIGTTAYYVPVFSAI